MIDMEHAPLSADVTTSLVHAVAAASARMNRICCSLVRVPCSGAEWIKWALDSGNSGIIIPMVKDAAEMRQIIDRALYPPTGRRSFGPAMAAFSQPSASGSVMGYFDRARQGHIAIFPMIESREGVTHVDEIMAVDGVTGVFIGPFDLRLAMNLSGRIDGTEPAFEQAINTVCDSTKRHQKIVGSLGMGADLSARQAERGMSFIVAAADSRTLTSGMQVAIAQSRQEVEAERRTNHPSL